MWRTNAVLTLLHEAVAGLPHDDVGTREGQRKALARARRRGQIVVALDWLAILVLVVFGQRALPLLSLGPGEQTVFTLAILAVATHAGFRLGQLEKLRAVARAGDRLTRHEPDL